MTQFHSRKHAFQFPSLNRLYDQYSSFCVRFVNLSSALRSLVCHMSSSSACEMFGYPGVAGINVYSFFIYELLCTQSVRTTLPSLAKHCKRQASDKISMSRRWTNINIISIVTFKFHRAAI